MDIESTQKASRKPVTRLGVAAAKYWRITFAFWLVVMAAGVFSFFGGLSREGFPPVNFPIVTVGGSYLVDDPNQVDDDIAKPLSEAFGELEGVSTVSTSASENSFNGFVIFEESVAIEDGTAAVEGVLDQDLIPAEADLQIRPLEPAKFLERYDILVSLVAEGDSTVAELDEQAASLAEFMEADAAVAQAEPLSLQTVGVNPATGQEEASQTRYSRTYFGNEGFRDSVTVGLIRADNGQDVLGFSEAINGRIGEDLPLDDGFTTAVTADFASDLEIQLSNLQSNLLTGLLAVAVVSLLLIGWRTALVTSAFMVTAVAAALAVLWAAGYSLNTITLFGLILTIGLLVDDAVVIAESVDTNRGEGPANNGESPAGSDEVSAKGGESADALGVVRRSLDRVGVASLSGTLTTVLVFLPMLFVAGILGRFIRVLPITVIITLLLSFVLSVVVISGLTKPFLLKGKPANNPIVKAEAAVGRGLSWVASRFAHNRKLGVGIYVVMFVVSLGALGATGSIARNLEFNIFPPAKDANAFLVTAEFEPGATIDEASTTSAEIDDILVDVLGEDLRRAQYIAGGVGQSILFVELTPFDERDTKSPVYLERLEAEFDSATSFSANASQIDGGPPSEEFPFKVQIQVDDDSAKAGEEFALRIAEELEGETVTRDNDTTAEIVETSVRVDGSVSRTDGDRFVEVGGRFDADDVSALLESAKSRVNELYPAGELAAAGLTADALEFDFGQESENSEGFASTLRALVFALVAMYVLLVVQFRSLIQPLLVFVAIPFGLLGVVSGLSLTDNSISFFVMIGLIGLIGIVVNNTILLTDAANQARREGLSSAEAVGAAIALRFRPLLATTVTTVVGLAPLALSDPFWEALAVTIIFGLVASTALVLLVFPAYYMFFEGISAVFRKVFAPVRNLLKS